MNQKELYIQYLEDALNHAKTGEPMKKWQVRWMNSTGEWQNHIEPNQKRIIPDNIELRIKPEPFKWTTFAYRTADGIAAWVQHGGHYTREELEARTSVLPGSILSVHHHEIEPE